MNYRFEKIELEGLKIRLAPLAVSHREGLLKAAADGKLWELWYTSVPSENNIDYYFQKALEDLKNGTAYPFVIIDQNNGEIIGCTRFCNVSQENRRLEIGYTWYGEKYQGTGVNTECKYLLLKYAFEELDCIAVEFRTNRFNLRSRSAISRLGAKQDGILRNHQINKDGSYRDTVVYSITDQEWHGVKKSLNFLMNKYDS